MKLYSAKYIKKITTPYKVWLFAFPRRGLTMSKTGDIVTIKMTDDPNNSDFEYMAHRRGDTQKDMFYIGAYKGSVISDKLRSLSGKTPTTNQTIGTFRTYARNNSPASNGNGGSGYDQLSWYQVIFLQCMYVLKYKNLNSQAVIGNGVGDTSGVINTGGTETKGMDWGTTSNYTTHVKGFGIEDIWGNYLDWIDGIYYNSSHYILTATENFNNNGSGYIDRGASGNTNWIGYAPTAKMTGTTHSGFIAQSSQGSETTYYCDQMDILGVCPASWGGPYNQKAANGIFRVCFYIGWNNARSDYGGRLMYL